jgi:hypothetical protein
MQRCGSQPTERTRPRAHHTAGRCGALLAVALIAILLIPGTVRAAPIDPSAPNLSAEEQIALKFAPIAMLKEQDHPCDSTGEPYAPAPVDVVLNDPQVLLRAQSDAAHASGDPVIVTGPSATDLAGQNDSDYLDLPGNPLHAGCSYEQFFRERMGDTQPMVYAHIATEEGVEGFAIQYWFYYVFNRFNNLHESDWEMIQLSFPDLTVEEALATDAVPDGIAFAQHGGGEKADWDGEKLRREETHPLVYPAAGSHAAYYGDYIYLGWGERGSGLGCDDSSGPSVRTPLAVTLLPGDPTAQGAEPWLTFEGRWGERRPWEFNGPTGPNTKPQWTEPFSWADDLRESSLPLISSATLGPDPTSLFCSAVSLGSRYIVFRSGNISVADLLLVGVLLIPLVLFALTWRVLFRSLWIYARHAHIFLLLGLAPLAIAIIDNLLEPRLQKLPVIDGLLDFLDIPLNQGLFVFSSTALQQVVSTVLVLPAIIFAVREIQHGRTPGIRAAARFALGTAWTVLRATLLAACILVLLTLSIVGIPWAVMRVVRWMLTVQAIVIDGAGWRDARHQSARAVEGHWWRTALLATTLTMLNSLVGPLLGLVVLIFVTPSTFVAQTTSSLVYSLLFPLVGIATTLWFEHLQRVEPEPPAEVVEIGGLAPAI